MKKLFLVIAICIFVITAVFCANLNDRFDLLVQENTAKEPTSFRAELTKFNKTAYCDVYLYGVDVTVIMNDGEGLSLESAIFSDTVGMQAVFGYLEDKMEPFRYFDGGSLQYVLDNYNVFISYAVWDGDDFPDAVYFYPREININEVRNNL
jgi:hypothetical protein